MELTTVSDTPIFRSVLSFRPLFRAWEDIIQHGRKGHAQFYSDLYASVSKHPELLEPIYDENILKDHGEIIEQIMSTLFPVTLSDSKDLFCVAVPFSHRLVYASELFQNALACEGNRLHPPESVSDDMIRMKKLVGAYQLILKKFYNIEVDGTVNSVYVYKDVQTGLDRYMELKVNPQFVDVHLEGELPPLDDRCYSECYHAEDLMNDRSLLQQLAVDRFVFEGIAIIMLRDVTDREIMNNIKNGVLNLHSFSDTAAFRELQRHIGDLAGITGVRISITPFFKVNNHFVFSDVYDASSIFLKNFQSKEEKVKLANEFQQLFSKHRGWLVIPSIDDAAINKYPFLRNAMEKDVKSIIICPLYNNNELTGLLELVADKPDKLNAKVIAHIDPAVPLFELALQKGAEILDTQIDKIIKEQFTAVQSSVEWKFTETALEYLNVTAKQEDAKIAPIAFEEVYPLYGAIDIRNSSTERNLSIQKDLLEQLQLVSDIIHKALDHIQLPLLQEIDYKITKFKSMVAGIVFTDEELSIEYFLRQEIQPLFQHLKDTVPGLQPAIDAYSSAITNKLGMVYHHRKAYEESITFINNEVARFIDREQVQAQNIFPHYFERFVTDGVDFNIYIGQSITPSRRFNPFYLKNLKVWQLTTLARAARLSYALEKELSLSLHTTQLILAHSHPISISFRPAERKFDVDGAYNIRYEIIKKRIDKVRIRLTNERLTQPGAIAIVYSQPNEAAEYMEYIEFLQNQGLLKGEVQQFELEELQGVSGLKGLRVSVAMEEDTPLVSKEIGKSVRPLQA